MFVNVDLLRKLEVWKFSHLYTKESQYMDTPNDKFEIECKFEKIPLILHSASQKR